MVVNLLADAEAEVDRIFQALADATRRDIVRRVIGREQNVTDLADRYAMSFAAVQKHVAVLQRSGLVAKRRRGREQLVATVQDGTLVVVPDAAHLGTVDQPAAVASALRGFFG